MLRDRYLQFEIVLILITAVATALAYPHLPALVPRHWNLGGQVNGYSPRWIIFVLGPGFMALFAALSALGPWLSPKKFSTDNFRATYRSVMLILIFLMGYIELCIAWSAVRGSGNPGRFVLGGLSIMFALIGNLMGKLRRNFFIGVRTPWTLASERVWYATHRFAAKVFVAAGLTGLMFVLAGWTRGFGIAIIVGAALPIAFSLAYYKRLERLGEL